MRGVSVKRIGYHEIDGGIRVRLAEQDGDRTGYIDLFPDDQDAEEGTTMEGFRDRIMGLWGWLDRRTFYRHIPDTDIVWDTPHEAN